MELRVLAKESYEGIYEAHMRDDFAADELKPLVVMLEMYERGAYVGYGLFEGDALLGYAFLVIGDLPCALLDYLAICKGHRNEGAGSHFLDLIMEKLKEEGLAPSGVILESERPEAGETEEEQDLRQHRLGFYDRNGFRLTQLHCFLFGVDFRILHRPAAKKDRLGDHEVFVELKRLYQQMGIWGDPRKIRLWEN